MKKSTGNNALFLPFICLNKAKLTNNEKRNGFVNFHCFSAASTKICHSK